jgi:hypothetical protein
MHALTFALQSAALTGELSAIENAIAIPTDFHTSFLRKLLKAINATGVGNHLQPRGSYQKARSFADAGVPRRSKKRKLFSPRGGVATLLPTRRLELDRASGPL